MSGCSLEQVLTSLSRRPLAALAAAQGSSAPIRSCSRPAPPAQLQYNTPLSPSWPPPTVSRCAPSSFFGEGTGGSVLLPCPASYSFWVFFSLPYCCFTAPPAWLGSSMGHGPLRAALALPRVGRGPSGLTLPRRVALPLRAPQPAPLIGGGSEAQRWVLSSVTEPAATGCNRLRRVRGSARPPPAPTYTRQDQGELNSNPWRVFCSGALDMFYCSTCSKHWHAHRSRESEPNRLSLVARVGGVSSSMVQRIFT